MWWFQHRRVMRSEAKQLNENLSRIVDELESIRWEIEFLRKYGLTDADMTEHIDRLVGAVGSVSFRDQ